MRERLFPRWDAALFALLPLGEVLYTPVNGQTMYAAALACLFCALFCAGAARLAPHCQRSRLIRWLLALASLWPLCRTLARMGLFLRNTVFPTRPVWSLLLLLAICAILCATAGFNRCAMWALPIAWLAGAIAVLSCILTISQLTPAHWAAPEAGMLQQTSALLRALLPAALILSLSLPEALSGAASRGLAAGGDFARHGEVFFAVPLLLCDLGRCAALTCVLLLPLTKSYGILPYRQKKRDA